MVKRIYAIVGKIVILLKQRASIVLLASLGNAVLLTLLSYWVNNQAIFTGEDLAQNTVVAWCKERLGIQRDAQIEDAVFVNVAYDKQLINYYDMPEIDPSVQRDPAGNVAITDRTKLVKLLKELQVADNYKYIFLDIRFERDYNVPGVDEELFSLISTMKNIVVANHSDIEIADSILLPKAALGDFKSTVFPTNFCHYKYSYGGVPSMPLYAYKELTSKDITEHLFWYSCDGRTCYNGLFLRFPIIPIPEYSNLGSDILEPHADVKAMAEGKYVIIGDMEEDLHDTYVGKVPGSLINYYAFHALMENKHLVSYSHVCILALVYFLISLSLLNRFSIFKGLPYIGDLKVTSYVKKLRIVSQIKKSSFISFFASFIGWGFVLLVVSVVLNLFEDISISILIPSFYFTMLDKFITNS